MKFFLGVFAVLLMLVVAWPMGVTAGESEASLASGKWQYKVVGFREMAGIGDDKIGLKDLNDHDLKRIREEAALSMLNQLGEDRWELVTVGDGYFYFKRPRGVIGM